ncbi:MULTISPECIES: glycosyltransferase family 4 protein [unclassified Vibrio]|uniref:glycosyltransferase family 4 protein n=1 Tax=unclassified Vibrio TaxID=2614977 RepID=UPI00354FB802
MNKFDFLYITNVPSFYKISLYNEISKSKSIYVIFISKKSAIRSGDFMSKNINFPHTFIEDGEFEGRNKIGVLLNVCKVLISLKFKKIYFSGWEIIELIPILPFVREKKSIIIESSIYESKTTGIIGLVKKAYIQFFDEALVSGFLQQELVLKLGFKGRVIFSHGVGIPKLPSFKINKRDVPNNSSLKFLFVGRLAKEKNLSLLIRAINMSNHNLTIVGDGPLKNELEKEAGNKVQFLGYQNNSDIHSIYLKHDALVLPSLSEPWGLVVEEALSVGLPVVVSQKVGCKVDLVEEFKTGVVFNDNSLEDLIFALDELSSDYSFYSNNTRRYKIENRIEKQVLSYVKN